MSPCRCTSFSFLKKCPDHLWGLPSLQWVKEFFLEIKQLVHDVDHSPASRDKVMNEWSCISTPAICLHAMSKDNFTYYYYCYRMLISCFNQLNHCQLFNKPMKLASFMNIILTGRAMYTNSDFTEDIVY